MPVENLIILLATGIAIGFLSGLLGIGGGIIMTPVQYWLYTTSGMDPDLAIRISFATTLAVILPTAASGVLQHHRLSGVIWKAAVFMGIFTALGSFFGALLAIHISGFYLKIGFGVLALIIALRMLTVKISNGDHPVRDNLWLWFGLALPIGLITGLLGIGGGILVVPVFTLILRFPLRSAIATSLGMMLFTSVGGIVGYIINGVHTTSLNHTIGYIYWPAWLVLSITSIGMAQLGAITAHRIPARWLNYAFLILLFYISLDMLGAIDWIAGRF